MKNKKKKDVSDNSDSDKNDSLPSHLKNSMRLNKPSTGKNSPRKKPANDNDDGCNNSNEHQRSEPGVEEVLENEFRSENTSKEITDSEFRKTNSSNDESDFIKSIFNIEELTSDDEIYTLQCPENYLKKNLCNKTIDFTKPKQAIALDKEMYLIELLNCEKKFITLAVPKKIYGGSLVKMPLNGHIVIQKVVEMVPDKFKDYSNDEDAVCEKHNVVFPDNIKVRHPLLGVEWKTQIDLANEAIKKEYLKRHKSKKYKSLESKEAEIKNCKRESSNSYNVFQKKKRKKSDA